MQYSRPCNVSISSSLCQILNTIAATRNYPVHAGKEVGSLRPADYALLANIVYTFRCRCPPNNEPRSSCSAFPRQKERRQAPLEIFAACAKHARTRTELVGD